MHKVKVKRMNYLTAFSSLCPGGEEPFYHPLGEFDPPKPLYSSTEYPPLDNSGVLYSDHFTQSGVITELPVDPDSSADWEFPFPLLESEDVGDRPGEKPL